MAKPLKIILLVVGGLVLLVIAALIAVALLFDPNDYRGQIQDKVQEETGREFALGDIKLSVFPWLSVQLSDARLGNEIGRASCRDSVCQLGEISGVAVALKTKTIEEKVTIIV